MGEPSRELLRKEFAYDSEHGRLIRFRQEDGGITLLPRPSARPDGRVCHGVDGEMWLESRLIWIWHNGPIGDNNVRHKVSGDGDRIENLYLEPVR